MRALFCLTIFACISAQAQKITVDYDTKADFSKFKTYAWLAPGDSVLNRYRSEKLYGGYIIYAASLELNGKGLKMDTINPDAIFVYQTAVDEVNQYSVSPTLSIGVGVAGPGYYVGGYAPVAGGKVTVSTTEDGKIVYAMYDTQTKKLVWTGSAEQNFSLAEDVQKIIGKVTTKIFNKLPIKKIK